MSLFVCALAMSVPSRAHAQPADPTPLPEEPVADEAPLEPPPPPGEAVAADTSVADEAEMPVETATTSSDPDVVVTGTRVRSFGASAAPVEAFSRKQLEQTGASSVVDLITHLPSAQGSGPQGAVAVGAAGGAASALNLRGLGAGSTLILLNGRRLNPSAASADGLSDLNAVPLAAVEKIEILKAGAAAIYGADAVAGVVNIITRRNLNGVRIEADAQTTSRRDHGEYTLTGSVGATADRSRVLAAVSYFRRTELTMGERFGEFDKWFADTGNSLGTYTPVGGGPSRPDPACPDHLRRPSRSPAGGEGCGFWSLPYLGLFPNVERVNAFASGQFDINDHATAFGELTVSRYRGDNIVVPSFNVTRPFPIVPADHVDNPFGVAVEFDGRPLGVEYPPAISPASEDGLRGVVGLRGDFGGISEGGLLDLWQWELYASMAISRFRQSNDDNLRKPLQDALNSCSDPANLSNCFNPFYSAIDGSGTPNSQNVIRSFRGRQVVLTDHALQTYNLGVGGPLFELPGDEVGMALGGEIRHEWRATELDHAANRLEYGFLAGNENATASRDVYSGYLELRWPFVKGLELQTAVRIERYTDTDTTPSPFAGISIFPAILIDPTRYAGVLGALQLHFNVSRAFRAPSILETYPGISTVPTGVRNPATMASTYVPVKRSGNVDLKPQTATTFSAGFNWSLEHALHLTADYWYYGYEDRILLQSAQVLIDEAYRTLMMGGPPSPYVTFTPQGDIASVSSKPINVDAPVTTSGIDFGAMLELGRAVFGVSPLDFQLSIGASGTYTLSYKLPRNEVTGVVSLSDCEGQDKHSPCDLAGKRNEANTTVPALPRLKANIPLVFRSGGHSASAIGHYVSGFTDDATATPADKMRGQTDGGQIPAVFTLDLQYGYSLHDVIGKEVEFKIGILNATDQLPPIVNGLYPYTGDVHDPRGRMFYAKLAGEF